MLIKVDKQEQIVSLLVHYKNKTKQNKTKKQTKHNISIVQLHFNTSIILNKYSVFV